MLCHAFAITPVDCCLASCSPITKGNHLSTSGLPEELKLSQGLYITVGCFRWVVLLDMCHQQQSWSLDTKRGFAHLQSSSSIRYIRAHLEICTTSWLTQRWKRINVCCFSWRDLQAASLSLVTCTWSKTEYLVSCRHTKNWKWVTTPSLITPGCIIPHPWYWAMHWVIPGRCRASTEVSRGVCKILVLRKKQSEEEEMLSKCSNSFFH